MATSNMKAIKNRIKSVSGTRQLTKAMELVASSRMRRALDRAESVKAYFTQIAETISDIAADGEQSPYFAERDGRTLRVVIAGDRGLAGGYNHNLFKSLTLRDTDLTVPIGKKTADYLKNTDIYTDSYTRAGDLDITACREMGKLIADGYISGEYTAVTLTYTSYKNVLTQEAKTITLLPLRSEKTPAHRTKTIYEPSENAVMDKAVPLYLTGMLYGAVAESVASELSARRTAMESATDNADAMIDSLKQEYNRARQAAITRELTEIIAGAENL